MTGHPDLFPNLAEQAGGCAPGSPMVPLLRMAALAARRESPVLLQGESGTGKEVLARFLHARSPRAKGPFVAVNCSAISPGLIESELFGHRRGAFTHAVTDRPGNIRRAEGGTLFLDEIGDMPLELQAHLLRVLQERKVRPVGGDEEKAVDFRLICATHHDLAEEVARGRFRADLYYRLRVLELRLPPLRDRRMDIPMLLRGFLAEFLGQAAASEALEDFPSSAVDHPFPGNVRELRNCAERYAMMRELGLGWNEALERPAALATAAPAWKETAVLNPGARPGPEEVLDALRACDYHRGRAAERLGISRRTIQYYLKRMRNTLES